MKAVFLDSATLDSSVDFSVIESLVSELKLYPLTSPSELLSRADGFDIIITNKVVLDKNIIDQLDSLKLICVAATGTNNVDLNAAKVNKIQVANVIDYSTSSVAQHVFAYLLNYFSKVTDYQAKNSQQPWNLSQSFCQFHGTVEELAGKTLGIVGYGNIGQAVGRIAQAFGMQLQIAERPGTEVIRDSRVSFSKMLKTSDVISIHCPLTDATKNLIDKNAISQMKPTCVLVNTARGPVVDSSALAKALTGKQIAHAIIDVLEQEPPSDTHPLLNLSPENLTLTHHIAWGSLQAQQKLVAGIAENIQNFVYHQ